MKPRSPIARASKKVIAANGGKLPFSSVRRPSAKKPKGKKKRSASEFNRIYGSKKRVEWVSWQPCAVCDTTGPWPRHGHHIEAGGTGYKADYTKIVPLCTDCHAEVHEGRETFEAVNGVTLDQLAAETQSAWLEHSGETK